MAKNDSKNDAPSADVSVFHASGNEFRIQFGDQTLFFTPNSGNKRGSFYETADPQVIAFLTEQAAKDPEHLAVASFNLTAKRTMTRAALTTSHVEG